MTTRARLPRLGCMLLGALLPALTVLPRPGAGQPPPQRVITDTPEYCLELVDRLGHMILANPSPPPAALTLSNEGQRMCSEGQVRGGLIRVRRALVMMMEAKPGR